MQGFRSSFGASPGILDDEFAAFQSGHIFANGFHGSHGAGHSVTPELGRPGIPNWASEFQNLHLNSAPPEHLSQYQFREQAASPHGSNGDRQTPGMIEHKIPQRISGVGYPLAIDANRRSGFPQRYAPLSLEVRHLQPNRQDKDLIDDGALERAFEAVDEELKLSEEHVRAATVGKQGAGSINYEAENLVLPSNRNGALLNEDMGVFKEERELSAIDEADELARTAGELLDKVASSRNSKFRKSNFFSLMRQLRDREVQVEGDRIVDVSIRQSHHNQSTSPVRFWGSASDTKQAY